MKHYDSDAEDNATVEMIAKENDGDVSGQDIDVTAETSPGASDVTGNDKVISW